MNKSLIEKVFQAVDAADAVALTNFITPNGTFRFSNFPAIIGHEHILPFLEGFFSSIKGIKHSELEIFEVGDVIITNGVVTYTRHNNTLYSCNFSNTFKMKGELIDQYLIFVDNSKLYEE